MVTRWESSTRPLFVKTVWRDGQHHVVLRNEEESIIKRNINSSYGQSSARSVRSVSNNKTVSSASVKLLLTGVGTFNTAEQKVKRRKSSYKTTETVRGWMSPGGNIRQEVNTVLEYKTKKNLSLSIKSSSIDINAGRDAYDKFGTVSPYFSYNNYIEPYNNSLSERVMVWLDLAIQNGNYTKEVKIQPQRIVTACHIPQKRHHTAIKRNSSVNYKLNTKYDENENLFHVEGTSQALPSTNSQVLNCSTSPIGEEIVVPKKKDFSVPPSHQLSSEIEENIVVKDLQQTLPRNKLNSVKRQLHIFMPNLPKKNSDCDSSILSSKISTCSLQRSVNSKKL